MDKKDIITDPNELATIDINVLVKAVKEFLTTEELEAYSKAPKDGRRGLVIQYYTKYVINATTTTKKDEKVETKKEEVKEETSTSINNDNGTFQSANKVDSKTVQDESIAPGISVEDYIVVNIRNVPGFNGRVTLQASRISEMMFRYTSGTFEFKSPERAAAFINLIKGLKQVKGVFSLNDEKKEVVINNIIRTNKIPAKLVTK
jgi:hypothetical protein